MAANGGFGSKLPPLSPTNAADIRSDAANTGASVMQSQHFHCAPTAVRRSNPDRSAFAALIATAAVAIASMLPTIVAAQTPGALDANFALGNGKVPAIAMGTGSARVQSTVVQPDGKIVLFGYCSNGTNNDFCVARLNPDGNLDSSFVGPSGNGNGKAIVAIGNGDDIGQSVALQPDGKLVLLGYCSNGTDNDFCFARLMPDGTLDGSFTGPSGVAAGKFLVPVGSSTDTGRALLLQPDGKVVAVGYCTTSNPDFCAVRLTPTGALDAAFSGPGALGAGKVLFPVGSSNDFAHAAALQPDGKIVMVGACAVAAVNQLCAARLDASGALDSTFNGPAANGAGKFLFAIGSADGGALGVAVQPDGKLVLAGSCSNGTNTDFCFARLNGADGSFDVSFDGPGGSGNGRFVISLTAAFDNAQAVAVTVDGKILAAGTCANNFCLARINADGTLDTTFAGGAGTTVFSVGPGNEFQFGLAVQQDGKAVVAGGCITAAVENFCVARLYGGPYGYRACSPDIDGDNQVLATTDALIMTRVALGIRGSAVISGINFPPNASRNTWPLVRDYLFSHCAMSVY